MKETEYQRMLESLIEVTEANKGVAAGHDDRILDAEGLALKFVFHAASALYLYRSTTVPEIGASFFDPGSVNVLCRAALETFLVFHYVFVEPQLDDDRDCRYIGWVLAGYLERQKLPVWSAEARAVAAERQAELAIADLQRRLGAESATAPEGEGRSRPARGKTSEPDDPELAALTVDVEQATAEVRRIAGELWRSGEHAPRGEDLERLRQQFAAAEAARDEARARLEARLDRFRDDNDDQSAFPLA